MAWVVDTCLLIDVADNERKIRFKGRALHAVRAVFFR